MPIQAPSWTDFLNCPICCNEFAYSERVPISLGCGHTICKLCLISIYNRQCPFDQTPIVTDIDSLPINYALLQLVTNEDATNGTRKVASNAENENADIGQSVPSSVQKLEPEDLKCYLLGKTCIEVLASHLKPFLNNGNLLTRPMQRKLVTMVNCQLMEDEGRARALRAARSLGERTVTELILQHQNPQQLSSNLWAAVRTRGCQFLGPAMQEEVLKLVLLALEEGSALSRKVLVMFVVQRLEPHYSQASKTSIGHVVQLLYRASCFKVSKREADSSLMQLKEEFRTYDALRREHDAQIVQIATEAGLRIAPEQWSSLLYGDIAHKSHMQSIIDKLQTPSSFAQSVQELVIALQRTNDPAKLANLHHHLQYLANIDPCVESAPWDDVAKALTAVRQAVVGLVHFLQHHGIRKTQDALGPGGGLTSTNTKYKISLCRDLSMKRVCPRGSSCTFAHSEEELERFRGRNRGKHIKSSMGVIPPLIQTPGNAKKPMQMGDDISALGGPIVPIQPMHYMQQSNLGCGNFVDTNCALPQHSLSPSAGHTQQLMHSHLNSVPRQQSGLNGLLTSPSHYNSRFDFPQTQSTGSAAVHHTIAQPRTSTRHSHSLQKPHSLQHQPQRNPPNFNVNSNNIHMPGNKGFCNILPSDAYQNHAPYFGTEAVVSNIPNNNIELPAKIGHARPQQLWEHQYSPQHSANVPSTKNHNRPMSIVTATTDTSFFEKKPPNNISVDINNSMRSLFWNNASKTLADDSSEKHQFRETSNFVRSDSILDDDTSTFDVPTGPSNYSPFGPICPKRSSSNWNNWLAKSEVNCSEQQHSTPTITTGNQNFSGFTAASINSRTHQLPAAQPEIKTALAGSFTFNHVNMPNDCHKSARIVDSNDNTTISKDSASCDNVFFWNGYDTNTNVTNYWSNSNETPGPVRMSAHNERLKLQLGRKPQLMSEDSFEGGIDSGKMSELEKELNDIVEVSSNPDDSGIKLD